VMSGVTSCLGVFANDLASQIFETGSDYFTATPDVEPVTVCQEAESGAWSLSARQASTRPASPLRQHGQLRRLSFRKRHGQWEPGL
jgi:hypothetical protein